MSLDMNCDSPGTGGTYRVVDGFDNTQCGPYALETNLRP